VTCSIGLWQGQWATKNGTTQSHSLGSHDVNRFDIALVKLDTYLASDQQLQAPVGKLLQGPIADALTHIGQIATMRRLAGAPIKGESYFAAEILNGRVGPDQSAPRHEFD
jgi:hypothetical protein